jgi:KAP family P-loop domain
VPLGQPLAGHAGPVLWGAWAEVGGRPVLATSDGGGGTVRLWDGLDRAPLGEPLAGHAGPVLWGAWAEVGGRPVLVTGGDGGGIVVGGVAFGGGAIVRLWEVVEDRPVPRLPSYRSDVPAAADELARAGDAQALAELVTAVTAAPPLAVGLFGDWGEGKSHFLGLLAERVEAVAGPGNPLACSALRQVRFNAWNYAETDLWASLVAELFAQLAAPPGGDPGTEQRRQSRLAADLITERGLGARLRAARARRDELQEALRNAEQGGRRSWEALPEEQRQQLAALSGGSAERLYREAARAGAALRESARSSGRLAWAVARSAALPWLAVLVLAVGGAAAVAVAVPGLLAWLASAPGVAAAAAAAVLWRQARAAARWTGQAWNTAIRMGEAQQQRLQNARDVAAAEAVALERGMQDLTAAGQLAGLVADRAAGGDYRRQLGVMTQIREDFARMSDLLARAAGPARPGGDQLVDEGADAAGDTLPRIDRIILYIDDLDRCPPRRVVEMLEAIHLLLAVPLFVVVVAVDPRWLLRAVTAHYRDLLQAPAPPASPARDSQVDPDDAELWNSTPAHYLEKIFQVVLTLPPLDTSGYQRLLRSVVGTRDDRPPPPPAAISAGPAAGAPPAGSGSTGEAPAGPTARADGQTVVLSARLPAGRVIERVDPLTLEPDELALLDLLGPPLLVATPRAVKRLANSYGLLTALRREHRAADLSAQPGTVTDRAVSRKHETAYYPYRAGMVLLAALVAFPALGPALFLYLHHAAAATPGQRWEDFLDSLAPVRGPGGWHNPADPEMTPVQAQQWQALLDGLRHASRTAARHHLPLPEPLSAWLQWVIPVGRLSFPTGRIVGTLDRQRPLPLSLAPPATPSQPAGGS